ncbi:hypothetical protein, variant 1 [Cryptococcus amylolentus CBS 6039]|uniref:Uncharacterized protein n=1 Tax=Cryptococcus amylolentus CBS 6039 TaxID=1295533 RepID=A0A1E3I418_9TREE|nr:hypothetical protein, variant 1 [Cryptococcus amylolentus CBS 6039]ODN83374.1 hypothetical protein, variant 1 [Cryptococcus amylolentus CBS 6039]
MHPLEIPWVLSPPIILHTLSIPAIGVACFHSLNVWRAVSVLSARDASPHRVSSSRPATETAYQKWRAQPLRAKGKTVLAFASVLAIWVLICFTVIHLFPKIKSQPMMDTIVSVGLILSCAPSIYVLIGVIKPLPMHVRYTCKSPNGPTYLLVSPMGDPEAGARQQILRAGLSLAAAIGIVILAAGGFTAHLPFLVAIMTCWSVVAKPHFPRMSIRANILQPLKLVVFVCVFNGGVRVIANHYAPSGDSQEVPPPDNTAISDWVLYLGLTISSIGPMIMPGIMTAMTFRFEYSQATEEVDRPAQISGEAPVRVPSDYPSFSCPITITSLASLFLSLALMDITLAQYAGDAVIVAVTPIPFILTVPVVSLCTALAAAQQGKLGLWWRYNEW